MSSSEEKAVSEIEWEKVVPGEYRAEVRIRVKLRGDGVTLQACHPEGNFLGDLYDMEDATTYNFARAFQSLERVFEPQVGQYFVDHKGGMYQAVGREGKTRLMILTGNEDTGDTFDPSHPMCRDLVRSLARVEWRVAD